MSALTTLVAQGLGNQSLEQLLMSMCRYGVPRLSRMNNGWYCVIEMNTNAEGAKFDIRSESDMPTPTAAVLQCIERIEKAVKTIGGAT